MKPTVVLVHGAFAESASWNGVIRRLHATGHRVIAAHNPLRSLDSDAAAVSELLASIRGPIVLAGHSYGGSVITNAARDSAGVKALVYVAGLAPDTPAVAVQDGNLLGIAFHPELTADDCWHAYFVSLVRKASTTKVREA